MNISSINNRVLKNTNLIANEALHTYNNDKINLKSTDKSDEPFKSEGHSFEKIINTQIQKLNNKQLEADALSQQLISGDEEELHTVMIATEEAKISLELAVQIRNKCIEAYRELNNIQL